MLWKHIQLLGLFVGLFWRRPLYPQKINRYDCMSSEWEAVFCPLITPTASQTAFVLTPIFNNAGDSFNFEILWYGRWNLISQGFLFFFSPFFSLLSSVPARQKNSIVTLNKSSYMSCHEQFMWQSSEWFFFSCSFGVPIKASVKGVKHINGDYFEVLISFSAGLSPCQG